MRPVWRYVQPDIIASKSVDVSKRGNRVLKVLYIRQQTHYPKYHAMAVVSRYPIKEYPVQEARLENSLLM